MWRRCPAAALSGVQPGRSAAALQFLLLQLLAQFVRVFLGIFAEPIGVGEPQSPFADLLIGVVQFLLRFVEL